MIELKRIISIIIKSLTITAVVSAVIGFTFNLLGLNFFAGFFIAVVLQFFGWWLFDIYTNKKFMASMANARAQNNLADSYQNIELVCSYCGAKNITRILLNKNNTFKCMNCNNVNGIKIELTTTRTITPLIADKELSEIFSKLQDNENSNQRQNAVNTEKVKLDSSKKDK